MLVECWMAGSITRNQDMGRISDPSRARGQPERGGGRQRERRGLIERAAGEPRRLESEGNTLEDILNSRASRRWIEVRAAGSRSRRRRLSAGSTRLPGSSTSPVGSFEPAGMQLIGCARDRDRYGNIVAGRGDRMPGED